MMLTRSIQNRINTVREVRVILDSDLAELYEVETKVLNQAVKRNQKRFPVDFMFQLTLVEYQQILLQNSQVDDSNAVNLRSQFVTSSSWGGKRHLPFAFTEQGIAMLSGVLHSDIAIKMNIAIMRAFVEIKRAVIGGNEIQNVIAQMAEKIHEHDIQLSQIYDAIENLMDEHAAKRKWAERDRIGFRK